MKTSNKIFLIGLGVVLLFILVAAAVLRSRIVPVYMIRVSEHVLARRVHLDEISGVHVSGNWHVKINASDAPCLKVSGSKNMMNSIVVIENNGTLYLGIKHFPRDASVLKAVISLPTVHSIYADGASKLAFNGFHLKKMSIHVAGASILTGKDDVIRQLSVHAAGASKMDLIHSSITNLAATLSGASHLYVTMNGGHLTGSLSGASSLVYYGTIQNNSIMTSGASSVKKGE